MGERKGSARERKNQIKGRNSSEITELFIFPAASGDFFFFFPPLRPPRPSGLLRLQAVCYSPASHHPSPATKHHVHFITPPCSAQRDLLISVSPVFMCDSARNVFTVPRALLDTARLRLNINIGSEGGGGGKGGSSSPLIHPSFIKVFIWKSAGPFIWLLLSAGSNNNSGSACHARQTKQPLDEVFPRPVCPAAPLAPCLP